MTEFIAPTAEPVFYRTYSRMKQEGGRETWQDVCDRTIDGLAELGKLTEEEASLVKQMQERTIALTSGRWLWVGGTEWSKQPENFPGAYNCCSLNVVDWHTFGLLMSFAMQGTGTGSVIEPEYIHRLPPIVNKLYIVSNGEVGMIAPEFRREDTQVIRDADPRHVTIVVGDSRQGWVDAYTQLLYLASDTAYKEAVWVSVDLSHVRPAGEKLKGFGGTANPILLKAMFPRIAKVLNGAVGRQLSAVECCLVIDEAARVVVAGNIRRCLPGDTLVSTDHGLIPIKDVQIGDLVYTPDGLRTVTNKFYQGLQNVYEFALNGGAFRATSNHKMASLKNISGDIEWIQAGDLSGGDRLLLNRQVQGGIKTALPVDDTAPRPENSRTCKPIVIPELSIDIAWLIGYCHGNGHVSLGRNKHDKPYGLIGFSLNSTYGDSIPFRLQNALTKFGVNAADRIMTKENTRRLTVSSIRLAEYFSAHIKRPNEPLQIPAWILQASPEIRAGYLAGLYDSDGAQNNRPPLAVTTVYKAFAWQIAAVYASLGIPVRFSTNTPSNPSHKPKYDLKLASLRCKFNELIAPHSCKGVTHIGNHEAHGYTVPVSMAREALSTTAIANYGANGSPRPGQNTGINYGKLMHDYSFDIPITFEQLAQVSVEETWDIEVAGAHCFYANGILCHNSAGIKQGSWADDEFAAAKDNLWQQGADGQWTIDPDRDALRMSNHTRVFHHRPSSEQVLASVTKQFYSGEGAIQFAPEAIARANADIVQELTEKRAFIGLLTQGMGEVFLKHAGVTDDREIEHRLSTYGLNPCGEVCGADFFCNLSEVHLNQIDPEDHTLQEKAFRSGALSVVALLHHKFTEERMQYSRELDPIVGVSFTGLFDFFVMAFGANWLEWWSQGRPASETGDLFRKMEKAYLLRWKATVQRTIHEYCDRHGLKRPNRFTLTQPAGTKSLLTGASPGWHPPKAVRCIRRITFAKNDPVALACRDLGYNIIPSQSDKDDEGRLLNDPSDSRCTEWLVEIPIAAPWADMPGCDAFDINQFSAAAQFDFYMQVQKYYTTHNCFARSTEFLTDQGIRSFNDFEAGDTVKVLNSDGDWVPATVVRTGNDRVMYEIEIVEGKTGREKKIIATGCHRWDVRRASYGRSKVKTVTTENLKPGHRLISNAMDTPDLARDGIIHGMVFGDGSRYRSNSQGDYIACQLYLCAGKRELASHFDSYSRQYERDDIDQTRIYGLPLEYKSLPLSDCSQEYLAGFLSGYLATDGNIFDSTISLSTIDIEVVHWLKDQCPRLGIRICSVTPYTAKSGYNPGREYYEIRFSKCTFPENMVLRTAHLAHYQSTDSQACQWKVKTVTKAPEMIEGWCVMEPITNHFTLTDNILTFNTSATIELREHEIPEIADLIHSAIHMDDGYISATLLPRSDAPFPRMPFEAIDKATYDDMVSELLNRRVTYDFHAALAKYDSVTTDLAGPAGCDSDKCLLPDKR